MNISMTKKELANIAGYTYRRLYDIDRDLPESDRLFHEGEGGKYDLAKFVQKWVAYNVRKEQDGENTLDDVKAIHEKVKTRKTELEVAKMEGRLVDIQDVARLWEQVANTVMQNMLRMPSKIAPQVVMMENSEIIAEIIDKEIRDVLAQIADTPVPSYASMSNGEDSADEA